MSNVNFPHFQTNPVSEFPASLPTGEASAAATTAVASRQLLGLKRAHPMGNVTVNHVAVQRSKVYVLTSSGLQEASNQSNPPSSEVNVDESGYEADSELTPPSKKRRITSSDLSAILHTHPFPCRSSLPRPDPQAFEGPSYVQIDTTDRDAYRAERGMSPLGDFRNDPTDRFAITDSDSD